MVLIYNIIDVSSTTTITPDYDMILVNNPGVVILINLPQITQNGQRYMIKRLDNDPNLVSLVPNGSDKIYNNSSQTLGNYQVIEIVSNILNGVSNWEYIGSVYP